MLNRAFPAALALILGACSDGPTADKPSSQPTAIVAESGDGQTEVVDHVLAKPLVARVTDARGRGVRNASVRFEVISGGGTIGPDTVRTDTTGLARAVWWLGTSTAVEQVVRARVINAGIADLGVTFRATSRPRPASMVEVQASDERVTPAPELIRVVVARAYDVYRNLVPDATVLWSAPMAGTLRTDQTVTGPDGATENAWTLRATSGATVGEGVYWITATPAGARMFRSSPTLYVVTVGDARLSATALAVGASRTCALANGGQVYCWGDDTSGQPDDASRLPYAAPISIGAESFTQIVAGRGHTCALTTAGKAFCWGGNTEGQLGDGTQASSSGAVAVARGTFVSLVAGGDHTCGLTGEGAALCWGSNQRGQLGDGSLAAHAAPNEVSGSVRFTSLTAGVAHTCGLTTDGRTMCWGSNEFGQIGPQTVGGPCQASCATIPTPVEGSYVGLSAGMNFTCGVERGGVTWCWGASAGGRTRVPSSVSFASLVGSRASDACGMTAGGLAFCWTVSDDYFYAYPVGLLPPQRIGGALTFSAFRVGDARACGIERSNPAWVVCWGTLSSAVSAPPGYVLRAGRL